MASPQQKEPKISREEILAVLKNYKRSFAEKYGILELSVFGSVARNEATTQSDLDICIKMKTPDAFALVHVKEDIDFTDSPVGMKNLDGTSPE